MNTKISIKQVTAEPVDNKMNLAEQLTGLHNQYKKPLTEDVSITAVKDKVRDYIKNELDELFDNLAMAIHSDINEYDADWCSDDSRGVPAGRVQRAMLNLVDAAIMVLFENAKVTESLEDMDKRCERCNTLLNDGGTCPKCDDGEEDYGDTEEEFVLREDFISKKYELNEDVLEEGPISAMRQAFANRKDPNRHINKQLARVEQESEKFKNLEVAYKVLAKDFAPEAKNYIFIPAGTSKKLNYDQWRQQYSDVARNPNDDPEKYAQWFNAIVVKPNGYMIRRGSQDMTKEHVMLSSATAKVLDKYRLDPAVIRADRTDDTPVTEPTETPASDRSVSTQMLDKFVNIALATGLSVTNARNQRLSKKQTLKKITPETTDNYTVQVAGKDPMKLSDWLNQARRAGLLESVDSSELETAILVEDASSNFYFRTGDMFLDGLVNNLDEDEIDRNVAELESIATKLNVSVNDVVIFNDDESVYDPAYYEGSGLRYESTVGAIKFYKLNGVAFGHTYFQGSDWFYFASETEAETILNKLNQYGE